MDKGNKNILLLIILVFIILLIILLLKRQSIERFQNNQYTAIIIEPRKHKALEFVLNNMAENLDSNWNIIVFYGNLNEDYVKDIISRSIYKDRISSISLRVDNLTIDEYSRLLASENFYNNIQTDIFLVFQCDTMINKTNKNNINNFLKYDYVGAPWYSNNPADIKYNQIGNGGFSLRNKSKMLEIIKKCKYNNEDEDVYFSFGCSSVNIYKPSYEEAKNFSTEEVIHNESFGLHKVWLYHKDVDMLDTVFPNIKLLHSLQDVEK